MNKSMALKTNWSIFSEERDTIYGISIISIMLFHFFESVLTSDWGQRFVAQIYNRFIGSVGVEFFLFLSGVGLYFSLQKDENYVHFLVKRFKKVLPTYFIVAGMYWWLVDIVIRKRAVNCFFEDVFFLTFIKEGIRTYWYVLFIIIAYVCYPMVYKLLKSKLNDKIQLSVLTAVALAIQFVPRLLIPQIYVNIEILLCRFLVFFIGCWCGRKVYCQESIAPAEVLEFCFGAVLMGIASISKTKGLIEILGNRILMCFWGIFLLFILASILKFVPNKVKVSLKMLGGMSYELYLTHVAIRALMNIIGINTCYIKNYVLCIIGSFILSIVLNTWHKRIYVTF